jgi:hypothetical protein
MAKQGKLHWVDVKLIIILSMRKIQLWDQVWWNKNNIESSRKLHEVDVKLIIMLPTRKFNYGIKYDETQITLKV